jgi:nucleoside-diphosphate-sugar epimerase
MDSHAVSLSGLDARDLDDILASASRWTNALRGARVLVTGATGWFGTWLLDALVALDRAHALDLAIVAVSRDPVRFTARHPALASKVEWIAADVRAADFAIEGRVTHVIHAATEASAALNTAAPGLMFDTIVDGTRNVLRAAADAGARRVLLLSSGAVYGPQPANVERLDENHAGSPDPLAVANAYAEGKRAAEQIAAIACASRGLDVAIARCFAFVGPHMPFDTHFAIGNFIRDALASERIVVRGDGTPRRSYLYPTDLVTWLLTLLVEAKPLRAYNVGSPDAVTIGDLAHRVARVVGELTGRTADVVIAAESTGGASYVPSTERATRELGLAVRCPLDDAIRRTARWKIAQTAPHEALAS